MYILRTSHPVIVLNGRPLWDMSCPLYIEIYILERLNISVSMYTYVVI
jgi:hypothetical protein